MPTNIEIKAQVHNFSKLKDLAQSLSTSPEKLILQKDIFFNVSQGRLKLRIFDDTAGELIYYERSNQAGPKQSNYSITPTTDPLALKTTLDLALKTLGTVKKKRLLYMVNQTRIHLDQVEGLGDFMELEVVMQDEQSMQDGETTAKDLMQKLEINEKDLIDRAYLDLLLEKNP
jgi:predicted adenylyl cyclase CyaB